MYGEPTGIAFDIVRMLFKSMTSLGHGGHPQPNCGIVSVDQYDAANTKRTLTETHATLFISLGNIYTGRMFDLRIADLTAVT